LPSGSSCKHEQKKAASLMRSNDTKLVQQSGPLPGFGTVPD